MTRLTRTARLVAGLALAGLALTACPASRTAESTGEFLDNSVITTKVKAALLEDPALKSFQISVKSYKDVVQLSGFVDAASTARRAGEIAAAVSGVASVRNDLVAK
jgi:osmotically-inducible protein OsmY